MQEAGSVLSESGVILHSIAVPTPTPQKSHQNTAAIAAGVTVGVVVLISIGIILACVGWRFVIRTSRPIEPKECYQIPPIVAPPQYTQNNVHSVVMPNINVSTAEEESAMQPQLPLTQSFPAREAVSAILHNGVLQTYSPLHLLFTHKEKGRFVIRTSRPIEPKECYQIPPIAAPPQYTHNNIYSVFMPNINASTAEEESAMQPQLPLLFLPLRHSHNTPIITSTPSSCQILTRLLLRKRVPSSHSCH